MTACFFLNLPLSSSSASFTSQTNKNNPAISSHTLLTLIQTQFPLRTARFSRQVRAASTAMEAQKSETSGSAQPMKLLFVEMGVGYDQHGQDVTSAAMRACRDAITSNSIPAFRRGSIPGVTFEEMKLQIKLGVPHILQQSLDVEKVKSVFPYGKILNVEVVDGGLICSSGVVVEDMGDKNDDCYIVNAAVYIGY
ncbi:hypothetical protein RchiOBHm_Chr5g0010321 [Rosa chinensis]|uniref:50S ribosomal protein L34 n=1 Tax=Rosa chinensis TaxID=74649 RepID=A0A2P6Q4M4_ROSCH|nr:uncharacterized protein LOC112165259 [Rosa chinensis]PRQ29109.1 hypothetical protein RchiOBHm_Chr5g0010321 [Rosa chinensis]